MSTTKSREQIENEMREWLASTDGVAASNELFGEMKVLKLRFKLRLALIKVRKIEERLDKARAIDPLDPMWRIPFS